MSYEKKISRQNPGLISLLLDDSLSMSEYLSGTTDKKFEWVLRYLAIIFKELLARSSEMSAESIVVKARYYLNVIIYGGGAALWGDECMDIESAVQKYADEGNSVGLGGRLGGTNALAAFEMVHEYQQRAVVDERFRDSYPPMVFHLTDGESQTNASAVAEQIKQLATADGNVLIVNAYIGAQTSLNYHGPEDFPGYLDEAEAGPSSDNIRLFNMSSQAPDSMRQNLIDDGIFPGLRPGARLFFDVRTKEMLKHVIQVVGSQGSRATQTEK